MHNELDKIAKPPVEAQERGARLAAVLHTMRDVLEELDDLNLSIAGAHQAAAIHAVEVIIG